MPDLITILLALAAGVLVGAAAIVYYLGTQSRPITPRRVLAMPIYFLAAPFVIAGVLIAGLGEWIEYGN